MDQLVELFPSLLLCYLNTTLQELPYLLIVMAKVVRIVDDCALFYFPLVIAPVANYREYGNLKLVWAEGHPSGACSWKMRQI